MKALKVSELTAYINKVLKMDYLLQKVIVEGEISQCKLYPSGHLYLTLKDEESQIQGIMYKWEAGGLDFQPKHGLKVLVKGQINCYTQTGKLQLIINSMELAGQGALHLEFLKRKERLDKEGLFLVSRKKPIPTYPKKIGLITSLKAAALKDFIQVAYRRNPNIDIVLSPSSVQGELAAKELIYALDLLENRDDIDVIVITRGGGSIEDLWAFNDEDLIRRIASSKHPIVSAVGHEIDFTLSDFVADLRASTPSAAAEIIIPDRLELIQKIDHLQAILWASMEDIIINGKREVSYLKDKILSNVQGEKFNLQSIAIHRMKDQIQNSLFHRIKEERKNIEVSKMQLNPSYVKMHLVEMTKDLQGTYKDLQRAIEMNFKGQRTLLDGLWTQIDSDCEKLHLHKVIDSLGESLISIKNAKPGDKISIDFYDGTLVATIEDIVEKGE